MGPEDGSSDVQRRTGRKRAARRGDPSLRLAVFNATEETEDRSIFVGEYNEVAKEVCNRVGATGSQLCLLWRSSTEWLRWIPTTPNLEDW